MNAMTSRSKLIVLAVAATFMSACATPIKSNIDSAEAIDIGGYETYAWISDDPYISDEASHVGLVNPLNYQRVRAGIDAELREKGYRQVSRADADIVLGVTLGARDRIRVQQYYDSFGYRYFGYGNRFSRFGRFNSFGRGFGSYPTTTRVRTITEGTVAVDVFDNNLRQAIWHGNATRSLAGDDNGKELIAEAVDALIGSLPDRQSMAGKAQDSNAEGMVM